MGSKTVVEQFSAWNQQLKTLLQEADRPGDDDDLQAQVSSSSEDGDNDDDDSVDHEQAVEKFKRAAGKTGNDIYTLSIYNYNDDWADLRPGSPNENIIEELAQGTQDSVVIDEYLEQSTVDIQNARAVSQVFYNERTDRCFTFTVGISMDARFSGGTVQQMVRAKIIDSDQSSILTDIIRSGQVYKRAIERFDRTQGYRAGYDTDQAVAAATRDLLDTVNNPDLTTYKNDSSVQYVDSATAAKEREDYFKRAEDSLANPAVPEKVKNFLRNHLDQHWGNEYKEYTARKKR